MIKEKLNVLVKRGRPEIHTDISVEKTPFGKSKTKHRYLICDYCGEQISLDEQKDKRTGGTVPLSYIITKRDSCEIALCNKCVVPALSEF